MCAFYIFKIVQMVPDCAKHKYVFLFLRLFAFEYATEIVIQTSLPLKQGYAKSWFSKLQLHL